MNIKSRFVRSTGCLFVLFAVGSLCLYAADLRVGEDFQANELIETLTVTIHVGEGGDLAEPVALDLGLGAPLWLHPLGREEGGTAPFGAVPQPADASRTARAGSSASFTFQPAAASENDPLRMTSQLLDGVRISDIARIGFLGRGDSDWILEGYEIRINDKLFAEHQGIGTGIAATRETAVNRVSEINLEIRPLEIEGDELAALVESGLATEEDEARLNEIQQQVTPLKKEQNLQQRILDGVYPWFVESEFAAPGRRGGQEISDVRVTVVTQPHSGAATENYVFYRTGGHKYLLSSPESPLMPELGPQIFRLDLAAGPLTAADIRGHALGMIGSEQPYDQAPDRWHPQRLIVEVDGRTVYDSEENELDRLSLESIRIIPPAHFDGGGEIVLNTPTAREALLWEAGKGMGLDLVNGGAAELPGPDDEAWPDPEPGTSYDEEFAEAEFHEGFEEGFGPFPGESYYDDEWDVWGSADWHDPGLDPWDDGWHGDEWGWEPPPTWLDILLGLFFGRHDEEATEEAVDETDADPVGDPIQIDDVRLVDTGGGMQIQWATTGDMSPVDGFSVQLALLRPYSVNPLSASFWDLTVHRDAREAAVPEEALETARTEAGADAYFAFLVPIVAPQLVEDADIETPTGQLGPARPLVESEMRTSTPTRSVWSDGVTHDDPVYPDAPPTNDAAMWTPGIVESHIGFVFDVTHSGYHLVMRPNVETAEMITIGHGTTYYPDAEDHQFTIVALLGFSGSAEANSLATVQMRSVVSDADLVVLHHGPNAEQVSQTTPEDPQPMVRFQIDRDTTGLDSLGLDYRISAYSRLDGASAALDPDHPPCLIGVRIFRTDE